MYRAPGFRHLFIGSILSMARLGYTHQAIVFYFDDLGRPILGSIAQERGFYYETFHQFMGSQSIYKYSYPSDLPSEVVVKRALVAAGRPYHWSEWNCQHLAKFAHGLPPRSPDAEGWTVMLGLAALATVV